MIWLAEAFTGPAMMQKLAEIGFQQSYTYCAWCNDRSELEEYCRELAGPAAAYMRPSFWPTTHDILTPYMQYGGPTAWRPARRAGGHARADLQHLRGLRTPRARRPGAAEIRRAHPALHWLRNLRFHRADDDSFLVFSKTWRAAGHDDTIVVVANLDPHCQSETTIHLDMPTLGMGWNDTFVAHDLFIYES
ncbi:hypothetical protein ACPW96_18625 [Micromonospora sp. DT81.3]|uniref:hypothetical protein n=1 Tax=Micromonospora sp. DT81.3 TaxID=3416523 RepID=UPI003CE88A62